MFKRRYFIAGEIYLKNGTKTLFFRQFWSKSFFADAEATLLRRQEVIANDNNCEVTDLAITAFNRC